MSTFTNASKTALNWASQTNNNVPTPSVFTPTSKVALSWISGPPVLDPEVDFLFTDDSDFLFTDGTDFVFLEEETERAPTSWTNTNKR